METIINLEDAKNILIGENFVFGTHESEPIEWRKIDENLAISENVLDCVIFDENLEETTYDKSDLRKWCNEILGKSLGLSDNEVYVLSYEETLNYFPTDESRQATPSKWAINHGIYVDKDGYSPYWTSSPVSFWDNFVRTVYSSGLLLAYRSDYSDVGVRPALKLD